MQNWWSIVTLCTVAVMSQPADAEIFTQSAMFAGDLCATDVDAAGDLDDCATIAGNGGQPHVCALEGIGQARVIDSEEAEQSGLEVIDVNRVFRRWLPPSVTPFSR